ncbi:hypothetical protein DSAG12_02181 [Promethearchaeum syntrophicum]|uniref:Uncharacterized protein n=1 Tax=Promethearchaeum syntrophicum TaxID=2594042 RepID=A0A5B9DBF6_9ARCH|nr:hypothetical protein [Candidatus Prometheoarchaeum syntrophicum]QEE16351.1 hypothetical protein DSAG12_02181 [Candidatus Prometheoarchaeum syntrophicum]
MIKMIKNVDVNKIREDIKQFKELEKPDDELVKKILSTLGIYDIIDLEVCLNIHVKRERNATMKMLERYLDDLTSGDSKRWADAKDALTQIYYEVATTDEEAFL